MATGNQHRKEREKDRPAGPDRRESILVHACCASCASYVLAYLGERFRVTAYYYNPNIQPEAEYTLRLGEMKTVCEELGLPLIEGTYDVDGWRQSIGSYWDMPERSERCWTCYTFRLDGTARKAKELGTHYFTTTLSVSPHKDHARLVQAGNAASRRYGVAFLPEDFKKRDGFKKSVQRSRELGLTRQVYCGCLRSLEESRERRRRANDPRR
jgi:predicted adenine nucleotide alpha hydrolase (AANH) superfamily ATPase